MDTNDQIPLTEPLAADADGLEMSEEERDAIYSKAVCRARLRLSLYIHATAYAVVMLLLLVINLMTTPGTFWVVWPFGGWGAGLLVHWFTVAKLVPVYESIKEKEIVRQLEIRQGQ